MLRERSPYGQKTVARKLGIGLRGYQKLEKKGTQDFDRCREVAKIHRAWTRNDEEWNYADADWIWSGRRKTETPDVIATLNGEMSQLDRIEQAVSGLDAKLIQMARDAATGAEALAVLQREMQAAFAETKRRAEGGPGSGD